MRQLDLAAFTCILVGVFSLAGSGLAESSASGDRPGPRWAHRQAPGPERFLELHADELGLAAETRAAIEKIVEDSKEKALKLRGEAREEHAKMRALLELPEPDEAAVMKLSEALSERELALRQIRLQAIMDIHGLLNEQQRAQLVAIRKDRRTGRPVGLLRACREDVRKVCAAAEPGRSMLLCLSENWDGLSQECRESLEGGARRGTRRGGDDGEPED